MNFVSNTSVRRVSAQALFILGIVWLVVRFLGLDVSPPGFWMDETLSSAHAICLSQTGKNFDGEAWPLYSRACGGGHHPLTLLAFNSVWIRIFGTSRAAFRATSAFFITLTVLGLFTISRDLARLIPAVDDSDVRAKRLFPWMTLLAALISPWGFQFSRVAWEGPLAPAFMILALASLCRCRMSRNYGYIWAVLCAGFAVASMSTYPPLRAVTPFVLAAAALALIFSMVEWRARWRFGRSLLVAALLSVVGLLPTLKMLLKGEINSRIEGVIISGEPWLSEHRGPVSRNAFIFRTFLDNIAVHLRPSYLFVHGDPNPRHSAQLVGQLSPFDMLALALVVGVVLAILFRWLGDDTSFAARAKNQGSHVRWLVAISLSAIVGGFLGVIPAALTWEGLPHALRSIGSWPFVPLFSAAILTLGWVHKKWLPPVVALTVSAYSAYFLPAYFTAFDRYDPFTYMRDFRDKMVHARYDLPRKPLERVIAENLHATDETLSYYVMDLWGVSCEDAKKAFQRQAAAAASKK